LECPEKEQLELELEELNEALRGAEG